MKSRDKVSITTLLYRHSPSVLVFAVLLGTVSGALYSLLIPFVMRALGSAPAQAPHAWPVNVTILQSGNGGQLFFMLCILILLAKVSSVILVNNIAKAATSQLRLHVAEKINAMHTDKVERFGLPRLLNILVDDVNNVASAAIAIPMLLVSSVTVIGMLAYLSMINVTVFLLTALGIAAGIAVFRVPIVAATKLYDRARRLNDTIQEGVRGLVLGLYELKLDREKSQAFIKEELREPANRVMRLERVGDAIFHMAGMSSDLLSFFIIGGMVFILPGYIDFPPGEQTGVVMALLYIAAPVAHIMGLLHSLQLGQVAITRIHELESHEIEDAAIAVSVRRPWSEYRIAGVGYQYANDAGRADGGFSIGPVDLTFHPAQINFIVGGNGSGKSTLSKLISLHYLPTSGAVYLDGERLDPTNLGAARARIAVIYSNYYVFGKLYRPTHEVDEEQVCRLLRQLGLEGKTEYRQGAFSTTRLSDGQRRRMALLVAMIEDRDIYVFDEWAADQDPAFKRVFYQEILPQLKQRGKLVIVITHDDRYFSCADRVIVMEEGRVATVTRPAPVTALIAGGAN